MLLPHHFCLLECFHFPSHTYTTSFLWRVKPRPFQLLCPRLSFLRQSGDKVPMTKTHWEEQSWIQNLKCSLSVPQLQLCLFISTAFPVLYTFDYNPSVPHSQTHLSYSFNTFIYILSMTRLQPRPYLFLLSVMCSLRMNE